MITIYLSAVLAVAQAGSSPPLPSAAAESPPPPTRAKANLASLVGDDDYPPEALQNGEQGVVWFKLFVTADGRVDHCEVTGSSGSPSLDEVTCRIMTERPQFEPARDAHGRPTQDAISSALHWILPTDVQNPPPPFRAAPLQALASLVRASDYPAVAIQARQQGLAIFVVTVGRDGKVVQCDVPPMTISPELAEATCDLVTERARFTPARDEQGKTVPDRVPGAIEWTLPAAGRRAR